MNVGTLFVHFSALHALLSYASLKYIQASVGVCFLLNIVSSYYQMIGLKILFWKQIVKRVDPMRCGFNLFNSAKGFALGIGGISVASIVLVNIDRVGLSKIIPLNKLGVFFIVTALALVLTCYFFDVGLPLLLCPLITVSSKLACPVSYNSFVKLMFLLFAFSVWHSITLLFSPNLIKQIKRA